jgi:hypothetical protein
MRAFRRCRAGGALASSAQVFVFERIDREGIVLESAVAGRFWGGAMSITINFKTWARCAMLASALAVGGCAQSGNETAALNVAGPASIVTSVKFKPILSSNGSQCTPAAIAGKWERKFPAKHASRGQATWTISNSGEISCSGTGCVGLGGGPVKLEQATVFQNHPCALSSGAIVSH